MSGWYKLDGKWYKRCSSCNQPNYVSNTECYLCGTSFSDGDYKSNYSSHSSGLKRCSSCGKILKTEEYERGFDYCYGCYKSRR